MMKSNCRNNFVTFCFQVSIYRYIAYSFLSILKLIFSKGQIISKGLFDVLKFSQKTNEQIRFYYYDEFVCSFFGRI